MSDPSRHPAIANASQCRPTQHEQENMNHRATCLIYDSPVVSFCYLCQQRESFIANLICKGSRKHHLNRCKVWEACYGHTGAPFINPHKFSNNRLPPSLYRHSKLSLGSLGCHTDRFWWSPSVIPAALQHLSWLIVTPIKCGCDYWRVENFDDDFAGNLSISTTIHRLLTASIR
jgi:hypothetical protein